MDAPSPTPKKPEDGNGVLVFGSEPDPDPNHISQVRASADKGDSDAQYRLAIYQHRVKKDAGAMIKWLDKAAAQNHAKAQVALGHCYEYGVGLSQNVAEAIVWFRRAAERGNAPGQYELGRLYYSDEGVPQDYQEAGNWFRKAAEQGHADAENTLGVMYCQGQGVSQDYQEAGKWYRKAAEHGHAKAQFNLGVMYDKGQGVYRDCQEAAKWYTKSAEQGNAQAQYTLGVMYDKGQEVSQDYHQAVQWYRKAAEQGYAAAQVNLGLSYDNGQGVSQDDREATKWYRAAAEQGDARGQLLLATKYSAGQGVPNDRVEAYKWVVGATTRGYGHAEEFAAVPRRDAEDLKSTLTARISFSEIKEGQRRADDFLNQRGPGPARGNQLPAAESAGKLDTARWTGFRGLTWGMNVKDVKDMVLVEDGTGLTTYKRVGDKLAIGAAELEMLVYSCYQDHLCAVMIKTIGERNFRFLKDAVFAHYGAGVQGDESTNTWLWSDITRNGPKDVRMSLEYNPFSEKAGLAMFYMPIMRERERADAKRTKEAGKDF